MSSTALQVTQKQHIREVEKTLVGFKEKLKLALPSDRNVEQEISSVIATVASSSALQKCSPQSIAMAAYNAATLGLPVSMLGLAYLVPYGQEAKIIVGYRGYVHLALATGFVADIMAEAVFEKDTFEYVLGSNPQIIHKPARGNRGQLTEVYAVARLTNGLMKPCVMSKEEVDKIRQRSKSANNGPWATDYNEMAKKTVVRRLCKMLPQYAPGLEKIDQVSKFEEEQFANEPRAAAPVIDYPQTESSSDYQEDAIDGEVETVAAEPDERQQLLSKVYDLYTAIRDKDKKAEALPKDVDQMNVQALTALHSKLNAVWARVS